jgi:hypothetical protein
MYDPTPQVGLPDVEYVEIHNVSPEVLSLSGWTLNEHPIPDHNLNPFGYLVLCQSGLADQFKTAIDVLGMQSWDRLNNTGQSIVLKDNKSNIIDSISYDNKWIIDRTKTDGGWSLELIKPGKICSGKDNWSVSLSSTGGTPGFQNSVYSNVPDIVKPYVCEAVCIDPYSIQFTFSETVDFSGSDPEEMFDINPGDMHINLAHPFFSNNQILYLTESLNQGRIYQIRIRRIPDCEGNLIADTTILIGIGLEPRFNELLMTELLVDEFPSIGLPESEYIEILNNSGKLLDLRSTYIFTNSKIYNLPAGQLFPGTYYLLIPESKAEIFSSYSHVIQMQRFPKLNNEGKMLSLYNRHSGLIFTMHYTMDWYKDHMKANGGYSLEMIDVKNPCGGISNWTSSTADIGGTPGKINSINVDNPDLSGPEIISAQAFNADTITIQFNEQLHVDCFEDLQVFVDHINMRNKWSYDTLLLNRIDIESPYILKSEMQYAVRISGIEDCAGNHRKNEENPIIIYLPQEAGGGDIVINEILFNPKPGGVDWIEIYNVSEKLIDLKNWYLLHEKSQPTQMIFPISGEHYIVEPYSFLVITKSVEKVVADFPHANKKYMLEMSDFPTLPDSKGFISLWTKNEEKMDEVSYHEDLHNLFLKNNEGVSLERVSPFLLSSEPRNWQSSSSESGYGTPTLRNSQYRVDNETRLEIVLSPLIFSPDQDGVDDYLDIQVNNLKPGFLANILIFDINGVSIKNLSQGYLMGTMNRIMWDGITDSGSFTRPGYYILLLELYHPDGDYSVHKQKFVVARRF